MRLKQLYSTLNEEIFMFRKLDSIHSIQSKFVSVAHHISRITISGVTPLPYDDAIQLLLRDRVVTRDEQFCTEWVLMQHENACELHIARKPALHEGDDDCLSEHIAIIPLEYRPLVAEHELTFRGIKFDNETTRKFVSAINDESTEA
jgi:hypothetical protein